jgi:hypothetical protein
MAGWPYPWRAWPASGFWAGWRPRQPLATGRLAWRLAVLGLRALGPLAALAPTGGPPDPRRVRRVSAVPLRHIVSADGLWTLDVFGSVLELSSLDGSTGFVANGIDGSDRSGFSVSGAGDVNGDGLGDVIIGVLSADPDGKGEAGESYVVFGMPPPTPTPTPTNTPIAVPDPGHRAGRLPRHPPRAYSHPGVANAVRDQERWLQPLPRHRTGGTRPARQRPAHPGAGQPVQGAHYRFEDQPGRGRFYYWLEDVDPRGHTNRHGPVVAPPAQVRPIELPPAPGAPWPE